MDSNGHVGILGMLHCLRGLILVVPSLGIWQVSSFNKGTKEKPQSRLAEGQPDIRLRFFATKNNPPSTLSRWLTEVSLCMLLLCIRIISLLRCKDNNNFRICKRSNVKFSVQ